MLNSLGSLQTHLKHTNIPMNYVCIEWFCSACTGLRLELRLQSSPKILRDTDFVKKYLLQSTLSSCIQTIRPLVKDTLTVHLQLHEMFNWRIINSAFCLLFRALLKNVFMSVKKIIKLLILSSLVARCWLCPKTRRLSPVMKGDCFHDVWCIVFSTSNSDWAIDIG